MPIDAQEPRRGTLIISRVFQSSQDMLALDLGGRQPTAVFRRMLTAPEPAADAGEVDRRNRVRGRAGTLAATWGRTAASISSPGLKRMARSMAFSSSRMLPGQG